MIQVALAAVLLIGGAMMAVAPVAEAAPTSESAQCIDLKCVLGPECEIGTITTRIGEVYDCLPL